MTPRHLTGITLVVRCHLEIGLCILRLNLAHEDCAFKGQESVECTCACVDAALAEVDPLEGRREHLDHGVVVHVNELGVEELRARVVVGPRGVQTNCLLLRTAPGVVGLEVLKSQVAID